MLDSSIGEIGFDELCSSALAEGTDTTEDKIYLYISILSAKRKNYSSVLKIL